MYGLANIKISSTKVFIFIDPAIFSKTALSSIQACRFQEREMKKMSLARAPSPVCKTVEQQLGWSFELRGPWF